MMIKLMQSKMNQFTYADWKEYFERNDTRRLDIPFQNDILTEEEKRLITPTICKFEQGEHSDGTHLKKAADLFAESICDDDYKHCIKSFIKEENVHSEYLRLYMEHHHIPVKANIPLDRIFRRLRRLAGLQCEVTVLVTAEIIALSYYDALMNATGSQALKAVCRQMLHDEIPHVIFQSYTLSHFKNNFPVKLLRILLMEITSVVTWFDCRRVFLSGGWSFRAFLRSNLYYLAQSIKLSAQSEMT